MNFINPIIYPFGVIPAKAGIQEAKVNSINNSLVALDPRLRGDDTERVDNLIKINNIRFC